MQYIKLVMQVIMLLSVSAMFLSALFGWQIHFVNMFLCFVVTGITNGLIYIATRDD
jgi:hypothetical protein